MFFNRMQSEGGHDVKQDVSPAQLRHVFGENLTRLSERATSVSQLCRDLGINRTQFNRYLKAEAFPRPDVLYRICQYFDVDARILLDPLDSLTSQAQKGAAVRELSGFLGALSEVGVSPAELPDGPYLYYRVSYFDASALSCHLFTLKRDQMGVMQISGFISRIASERVGFGKAMPMRRYRGIVFRQMLGFSFISAMDRVPLMNLGGFEPNYLGNPRFLFGSAISTQDVRAPSPLLLERLEPSLAVMIRRRHDIGIHPRRGFPALVRGYFDKHAPMR
ncbi:DNA-binding protein [Celeribacter baekdonensis B30]|uniref:DNA-binding protein n=1 Tax=Celeribacter baekdonensis B30 TaxID=1208323 RepID=K2INP6_9RHOB|nr:DNA-binding protein [Celeribacter baekdonensis B30]